MVEISYQDGVRHGVSNGFYENGGKAYESIYFLGEEVVVTEWTEDGELIIPFKLALGKARNWMPNVLDRTFLMSSKEYVYQAFGEPDKSTDSGWRYEGVTVSGEKRVVGFIFSNDIVKSISIDAP